MKIVEISIEDDLMNRIDTFFENVYGYTPASPADAIAQLLRQRMHPVIISTPEKYSDFKCVDKEQS